VTDFKRAIKAIATLIDEGTFTVDDEGLKLRAMDPSRVAMVDFLWGREAFEEFECDEPTKICVNLGELMKILKRAGRGEIVEFSLDETSGRLKITITNGYSRSFQLPILETVEEELPGELKIPFTAKITMGAKELRQAIEDAKLASDHIRIEASKEGVTFKASGDVTAMSVDFPRDSEAITKFEVDEETQAAFGLAYLLDIVKAASALSEVVSIEYATDKPIKLDFKLPYEGKLVFYLAPRVEVE